jgi:hypothetical protein
MPYQFHYFPTNFKGNLATEQCQGRNKNGQRCRRKCAIGFEYCFQHLRSQEHLNVKTSNIPNAGKGLFAYDKSAPDNAIIFRPKDVIADYNGEQISRAVLDERYGDHDENTAPYAIFFKRSPQETYVDAALKRSVAALANSKPDNGQSNAQFKPNYTIRPQRVQMRATKPIRNYQEIYPAYGRGGYRLQNNYKTKYIR